MKRLDGQRHMRGGTVLVVVLAALTLPSTVGAKDRWFEIKSPHFIVISNARERVALDVTEQFERIRAVFQIALPRARIDESRLLILAVKNEKSLKQLLPEYWKRKSAFRPVGVFRSNDRTIALRVDGRGPNPYSTIYHEYFHLVVSLNAPGLPPWLNEGLASYWQNTTLRGDRIVAGQPSGPYIHLLKEEKLLSLETVFTTNPASHDNRASMFYAQSWALTHYFLIGDSESRAHLLRKYIALINDGSEPLESARETFGDLDELENKLRHYISRPMFNAMGFRASTDVDPSTFVNREISEAESLAFRGHFLVRGGSPDDGDKLLKKALRKQPVPSVAAEAMGFLALRRGDPDASKTWFEKAASSPGATHMAHYMSATAQENSPQKEAQFLEAISLDHSFAPAYVGLAYYYADVDSTLKRSLAMVRAAAEYDPGSAANRLLVARVLKNMGEHDEAQSRVGDAVRLAVWSGDASQSNNVCWFGSLTGFASDVMEACEYAVEQHPEAPGFADSRGLAYALLGRYARAVADFEFFMSAPDRRPETLEDRKHWIEQLEKGENPFDEATLARLLNRPF